MADIIDDAQGKSLHGFSLSSFPDDLTTLRQRDLRCGNTAPHNNEGIMKARPRQGLQWRRVGGGCRDRAGFQQGPATVLSQVLNWWQFREEIACTGEEIAIAEKEHGRDQDTHHDLFFVAFF